MKNINFLYEFKTPMGYLPIGYKLKDLAIILSDIADGNLSEFNRAYRYNHNFKPSITHDPFDLLTSYIDHVNYRFNRTLVTDLCQSQIKKDHNLFVITTLHDESIAEYARHLVEGEILSNKSMDFLKNNNNFKLVLFDNKEGSIDYSGSRFFWHLHEFTKKYNLSKEKLIFITNTSNIKKIYNKYLLDNNIASFMKCESVNSIVCADPGANIVRYENTTNNFEKEYIIEHEIKYSIPHYPTKNIRKKYFLSLNRNSGRLHRPRMVLELIKRNLFDKGMVSLHKSDEFDRFCQSSENVEYKININDKYPFTIDYEDPDFVADMHNFFTEKEMWESTYFSLVAETSIMHESIFLTEKVVRPMIYFHPFIVYGSPGTLYELKNLGFKTFPEFFDESYDEETNDIARLNLIIDNVERLCKMSIDDLHKLYLSVENKLIYNRNLLVDMNKKYYVHNKFIDSIL
jgi:hypothetical protein